MQNRITPSFKSIATMKSSRCKKVNISLTILLIALSIIQIASLVASFHLPYNLIRSPLESLEAAASRRQDDDGAMDYDEMTPKASEQSHNNNDDNNGDGYGEAENDGPYEETPRDQEGQADLERFFDDHLGASDKDGMDKENLPTNLVATILPGQEDLRALQQQSNDSQQTRTIDPSIRQNEMLSYLKKRRSLLGAERADIQEEPYKSKLIIMRQMEDDGLTRRANVTIGHFPISAGENNGLNLDSQRLSTDNSNLNRADMMMPTIEPNRVARDTGADQDPDQQATIRTAEDEDMDKVYVTNKTDAPFRIDALGGYDPEEDFESATEDLGMVPRVEGGGVESRQTRSTANDDNAALNDPEQADAGASSSRESSNFNDPEVEALFNDASETDETFAQDEPDWADDKPAADGRESTSPSASNRVPGPERRHDTKQADGDDDVDDVDDGGARHQVAGRQPRRRSDADEDTSWVNDGVDDMEIPSKLDQERAIEKAARHDEQVARQRAADSDPDDDQAELAAPASERRHEEPPADSADVDEDGVEKQAAPREDESSSQEDPTDVRMPNADYMKNDMQDLEDETNLKRR